MSRSSSSSNVLASSLRLAKTPVMPSESLLDVLVSPALRRWNQLVFGCGSSSASAASGSAKASDR